MDECIIPCDGEDKKIVDNDLKAALVAPLPSGCYLVAVLDTCHSGSLLDLKHSWCNQVIVPWIKRGKRASGDFRERVVRKDARIFSRSHTSRSHTSTASRKVNPPPRRSLTRFLAQENEINMNLVYRSPPGSIGTDAGSTFTYRSSTVPFAPGKENDVIVPAGAANTDVDPALPAGKFWLFPEEEQRCQSPVAMFECNGWCRDAVTAERSCPERASDVVHADVVSLASCKDSETTYEDMDGKSMTASLVEILRRDPKQSVKDVLVLISHAMYKKSSIRHTNGRVYKKQRKEYVAKLKKQLAQLRNKPVAQTTRSMTFFTPDPPARIAPSPTFPPPRKQSFLTRRMDDIKRLEFMITEYSKSVECDTYNIQHPELASARPLDMNRQWKM
ncbi:hypothetical protein B0H19DRAFT_1096406 [Mycena capillaripes]|nr:hypothetical protein B0H19DRAFT_1096406 [Mycena capillaripes]